MKEKEVPLRTIEEKAVLTLIGFMLGIQAKRDGYNPKNKAPFNTNAYIAAVAVKPLIGYRRFFYGSFALLALFALAFYYREDIGLHDFDSLLFLGSTVIMTTIAHFLMDRQKKNTSPYTVDLSKIFKQFVASAPRHFVTDVRQKIFIHSVPSAKDTTDICDEIHGWETKEYARHVYQSCMDYLHETALHLAREEYRGNILKAKKLKDKLTRYMNAFAMIGAWPKESDANRGEMTGRLHAWAEKARSGVETGELPAPVFTM